MEDCKKYLKYNFRIENALGTSSATLENANQNPYKKAFSCISLVFIVSYSAHILVCLYAGNEIHVSPWSLSLSRILRNSLVIYTLVMGLVDSEGKRTTALNIAAIESHLRELNIEVPKTVLETMALYFSCCNFVWNVLVTLSTFTSPHYKILDSLVLFYSLTIRGSQTFGCLIFLIKCLRIKMSVYNELVIMQRQFVEDRQQLELGPYIIQRRVAWTEGSEYHRRNFELVRSVEAVRNTCLQEVKSCYRVLIILFSVTSAIVAPIFVLNNRKWDQLFSVVLVLHCIHHFATNIIIVLLVVQLHKIEESYEDKLSELRANVAREESRRQVRHLLLRHVHSSEPYDCYLFDVDFSLLTTMIETTLLVVTTCLSDG